MRPIDFDVVCAGCGYNLRGRVPRGRCSECGTAIGATINAIARKERPRPRPRLEYPWRRGTMLVAGLLLVAIASDNGRLPQPWLTVGWDAVSTGILAAVVTCMLGIPREWVASTIFGIASGLTFGTGLDAVIPDPCALGPVVLFAVPALVLRYDQTLDGRDLVWFWPVLAILRAPHLLL